MFGIKEDFRGFVAGMVLCFFLIVLNLAIYGYKCSQKKVEALCRIDPGIASIESLTRLEGIGQSKAENIVKFRQGGEKIENEKDLMKVKGIGKKTVEKNIEYLYFDGAKN